MGSKRSEITVYDARTAAKIDAKRVIYSPTEEWCPDVPFVDGRHGVVQRKDGRWGPQEFTRVPQLHCSTLPHHATIPAGPWTPKPHPDFVGSSLWDTFQERDLVYVYRERGEDSEVGRITQSLMMQLVRDTAKALSWVQKLSSTVTLGTQPPHWHSGAYRLGSQIRSRLDRLSKIFDSYQSTLITISDLQQQALELYGLMFYSKMQWNMIPDTVTPLRLRGAIFEDPSHAVDFWKRGIPVWIVLPLHKMRSNVNIASIQPAKHWASIVEGEMMGRDSTVVRQHYTLDGRNSALDTAARFDLSMHIVVRRIAEYRNRLGPGVISLPVENQDVIVDEPVTGLTSHAQPSGSAAKGACPDNSGTRVTKKQRTSSSSKTSATTTNDARSRKTPQQAPVLDSSHSRTYEAPRESLKIASWDSALRKASPIASTSVRCLYFFACPWLVRKADNMDYIHNHLRIRRFSVRRLICASVNLKRPLAPRVWADALLGKYHQLPGVLEIPDTALRERYLKLPLPLPDEEPR